MDSVWSCVLRVVPNLLAQEACDSSRGRRLAASAMRTLAAVSVESRLAVARACAAQKTLGFADALIAPHVELSVRSVSAYSAALCLLCGKHVHVRRARRTCSFRMHPTCVHKHRGMFAPLSSVMVERGKDLPFLVVDAFAYRKFSCVLLDRTWRFKETARPTDVTHRAALRGANRIRP